MKTYKRLWDKFISKENFDLAAKKAIKSKKSKKAVKDFLKNREENLEKLRDNPLGIQVVQYESLGGSGFSGGDPLDSDTASW